MGSAYFKTRTPGCAYYFFRYRSRSFLERGKTPLPPLRPPRPLPPRNNYVYHPRYIITSLPPSARRTSHKAGQRHKTSKTNKQTIKTNKKTTTAVSQTQTNTTNNVYQSYDIRTNRQKSPASGTKSENGKKKKAKTKTVQVQTKEHPPEKLVTT